MARPSGVGAGSETKVVQGRHRKGRSTRVEGLIFRWLFFACALISIFTTIGIVFILIEQSLGFFAEVSVWDFLTGTRWTPILKPTSFGVLPLVAGTMLVTVLAAIVALPVGLATAIYLAEYAPDRARRVLKPFIEILAGIPTVVYGYFALTFVTPLLQTFFPNMIVFNALSAGVVMGIMIIPMVSSLSEDAMISVPRSLRQASYALGATKLETSLRVVVPGGAVGHRGVLHPGHLPGDRRDDAGDHRRRGDAADHGQPAGEHPDDDGVHRPAGPGRGLPRLRVEYKTIFAVGPAAVRHDAVRSTCWASTWSADGGRRTSGTAIAVLQPEAVPPQDGGRRSTTLSSWRPC